MPVLDPGGLFKDHALHKVGPLSSGMKEMDALSLNYWLSKFVKEVAKKTSERDPAKTIYGIVCGIQCNLEVKRIVNEWCCFVFMICIDQKNISLKCASVSSQMT